MLRAGKRALTWLAIYAVAVHAILLGIAPPAAAGRPAFDPLSVICHSVPADQSSGQAPGGRTGGFACDHCIVCTSCTPPSPPQDALAAIFAPARVLDILRPSSAALRIAKVASASLARGPPLSA